MTKKALDTNDLVIVTKTHHNLSDLKKIGFLDKIFSKKILFISNKAHKDLKLNKVQWTKKKSFERKSFGRERVIVSQPASF